MAHAPRRSYVDEICELVGWQAGDFRPELDWTTVERELGTPLPSDYKELLTRFPSGGFRDIMFSNPGEGTEECANLKRENAELLEIFADEDLGYLRGVSYRLFPEPGGIYPWGSDGAGGTFWWVTGSADPDDWHVAYNDRDRWHDEDPGPMTRVIRDLLVSTGEDNIFGWDVSGQPVDFTGYWRDRHISHPG
ncbi:SMI1/KNR4 family protein [Saccharothrix deserti]|uniref:SMI1/KNR4 family protein n=1 Tax=Saccharothrix deserti TaxID=2593674 RepID=UPI00131D5D42|nr:SMI1/KNR4 family protein [Saccharothrix deserti]